MSSASFEFPFQLVITFIFGLVVGHYLGEIKILCWQFIGIFEGVGFKWDCDELKQLMDILFGK